MTSSIKVQIKTVYGEDRIYPACEKAEVFWKLVKQKTLSGLNVNRVKEWALRSKL